MVAAHKILLVDDEAIAVLSLRLELKRAGFPDCQIESSGAKAVQCALQGSFDAIIMDVHLAGKMTGLEAVRQIREAGLETPVIFLSGYADPEHMAEAVLLRSSAYLVKPVSLPELVSILNQIFEMPEKH